ncbi:MAG: hypothetical protein ABIF40_02415 [archaeon]
MKKRTVRLISIAIILILLLTFSSALVLKIGIFSVLNFFDEEEKISPYSELVQDFVEDCIENTALEGITFITKEGKTVVIDDESLDKKSNLSIKEDLELEISNYIDEYLPLCTNDFVKFLNMDVTANDEPHTIVTINEKEVIILTKWPTHVKYGNNLDTISEYEITLDMKLGFIHNLITDIFTTKEEVCFECLQAESEKENVYASFSLYKEDEIIITILEESGLLDKLPFTYMFRIKHKLNEKEQEYLANYTLLKDLALTQDALA